MASHTNVQEEVYHFRESMGVVVTQVPPATWAQFLWFDAIKEDAGILAEETRPWVGM